MALTAGSRLWHYDVTSLLGDGGMGQVWQATDTQRNRQVALKILSDAFADDPDRLTRFTREARILASLNYPNSVAIHGIEEDEVEGRRALVLELVEGPTLGPSESLSPIGAGGMGEVYKVTDTRLDRTVAIKVRPEHIASDGRSRPAS